MIFQSNRDFCPKNKKAYWLTVMFFTATLFLGFYVRNASISQTRVIQPLLADAKDYFAYAYNLRFKRTYSRDFASVLHPERPVQPDAFRNPGYPLFLALFVGRTLSGKTIFDILFVQVIISGITLAIAFYVFMGFLSRFWALVAAFLTAISPHLIVANSYILTETLFCFFLLLTGVFSRLFAERPSVFRAAGIGLCLGIGFLVRPSLLYFPIVMMVFLCIHFGRKHGLFYFAGVLAGFLLVASPWYIRNLVTLNTFSDQLLKISFVHQGIYPDFTYNGDKKSYGFPYRFDPRSSEISRNTSTVLNEIINRFRSRPREHIRWYVLNKPKALWSWDMVQGKDVFVYSVASTPYNNNWLFRLTHRLAHALHWPIVWLAFFGSIIAWFTARPYREYNPKILIARFVSLLLIYFTLLHMVGLPFPRYSVPLRPLLFGMALFTLTYIMEVIQNRNRPVLESTNDRDENPNQER